MADILFASGSVTQANMRLATVANGAFVDFSAAGLLTPYLNMKLVITANAKNLTGYIKAAGVGSETLGAELTPNSTALADSQTEANATTGYSVVLTPTTFASVSTGTPHAGTYHFSVVSQATAAQGFRQSTKNTPGGDATGKLIKHVWWQKSDGTNGIVGYIMNNAGGNLIVGATQTSAIYAAQTIYAVGTDIATALAVKNSANAVTTFYVDTYSAMQVTAPSATGVTIVSAFGGSTQTWAANDGIDPNYATGYTYAIYADSTKQHRQFGMRVGR